MDENLLSIVFFLFQGKPYTMDNHLAVTFYETKSKASY
jgi:hypothetical protein